MRRFYAFFGAIALMLLSITASFGAEFFRKQTGITTMAGTSTTVAITAVDMSKSFLVFSSTIDSNEPQYFQVGGEITNSTTLTFERTGTGGTVSISWQVFEFESGVFVQHGSSTNVARNANVDVGITCIDLAQSFVLISARKSGSSLGNDDGITANLTSATNLQLFIAGTGGANMEEAYWQVIEYQGAIVKKLTTNLNAGSATATSTIAPPISNLAKAMVISNHTISTDIGADNIPRTELTNSTTVTYTRVGTTGTMGFVTYVVEFTDQTTVLRGIQAFGSGSVLQDVSVASATSSGVFAPGNFGRQGSTNYNTDDNTGHNWFTYEITSPTNLRIQRAIGVGSTANAPWQIATFENTNSGLQTSTFYSIGSGDWEDSANWSYSPDGSSGAVPAGVYPRRTNNVVIQNGHTIDIDNVTDNNPCSQSPNGLGLGNVGAFTGSGDQMFYHTGDILIASGGMLTSTEEVMIGGYTLVENGGTLTVNEDIINLGYFEIASTATFSNTDDLILSGNSITIIDNLSFGADDIYIDWTDATLCGEGIMNLGNGGADPTIQFFNGGSLNQVCSTFTVTCTSNCGAFPIAPTGSFSSGNSGPGGVGSTTGSGDVRLWLDANTINQADATNVTTWTDQSGYGNDATAVATFEPVFNTNQLNGFPDVHFTAANSDYLEVLDDVSLSPLTVSLFIVGNHSTSSDNGASYLAKLQSSSTDGYSVQRIGNSKEVTFLIDGNPNTANSSTGTYDVSTILSGIYDKTDLNLYLNSVADGTDTYSNDIATNTNNLFIGAVPDGPGTGVTDFLDGDIAEAVVIGASVNTSQRIIVENYLSSKYDLALSVNDVYVMDDNGNGDYDFEVAGIGQAADGSNHRDAKGTDIVRMWNPNNLGNSEFLMWGHDNTPITTTTTASPADVDGTIIEERLSRIWRLSESGGDVGTVSISFDFNGVGGSPLGSNLRLLIDRDGDGFGDNDVTPIVGTVSGGIAVFSNVNFQNGDRFTLGNTDASVPLPIELIKFEAKPLSNFVRVNWKTTSELNNDFFTLEKSLNAEEWESVVTLKGAGTSAKTNAYETIDYSPYQGQSYYRLKQTDYDGQISYSQIEHVIFNGLDKLIVSPNPSNGIFKINEQQLDENQVRVYNGLGQRIPALITMDNSDTYVNISELPNGLYIMQISNGTTLQAFRLVKK